MAIDVKRHKSGDAIPSLQLVRHVKGEKGIFKTTENQSVTRDTTVGELVDILADPRLELPDCFIVKAIGKYK